MQKGLTDGASLMGKLAKAIGISVLILVVMGIIVGVFMNQVTSGNIPVSDAMNTSLSGIETEYISAQDALIGNVALIAGLVALVIILAVFAFVFKGGDKGSSDKVDF